MDGYREIPPPPAFDGLVDCLWRETIRAERHTKRIVPDGCVDVICDGRHAFVAGPDTVARVAELHTGTLTGIRFSPGVAPAVLGVPADVLRDSQVALADVWSADRVERLGQTMAAGGSMSVLAQGFAGSLRGAEVDPLALALAAHLRRPDDETAAAPTIRRLARVIGISERHLQRRCVAAFGYGPKHLHRVLRFHRATALAWGGTPFAEIAARTGYADQPHLAREVRALAGVSLTDFLAGSG